MRWMGWLAAWLLAGCGSPGPARWTAEDCLADPSCPRPLVSAHRGLCGDEPENTLAAYLECERLGVPMVEVDTRETADGAVVIMHDDDVGRTTDGATRFPGRTRVDQLSLDEFLSLVMDDPRCRPDPEAAPDRCRPPSLAQLLARGQRLLLDIDFKAGDPARLGQAVQAAGAVPRVLFFDSDLERLRAYRRAAPGGLVMPRGRAREDFQDFVAPAQADLELRWAHGDPDTAAEATALLGPAGVRLYLNGFVPVDPWLFAAELTDEPGQRAELLARAWQELQALRDKGAAGFGTDFAAAYAAHLYPEGW
jgi:glycerophosphoryl diester phosphodiesterase